MKRILASLFIVLGLLPSSIFASEHSWFTIIGDPLRGDVDTIQVDAMPVAIKGDIRLLNLRLSRARPRTSADGIVFRSFHALTEFDCRKKTARYTRTQFYAQPLWQEPGRVMDYPSNDVRPMAFREIQPNPNERIIRAACTFERVLPLESGPRR